MKKLCIVIPCYNEEVSLSFPDYGAFIDRNPVVVLCFVNDASKDNTLEALESLRARYPHNCILLSYTKNQGKAEAVRRGIKYANNHSDYELLAYLDADLSTSLAECNSLSSYIKNDTVFVFGSRIMKIGSTIERNAFRFIAGRVIATIISHILDLKVYDTQCGCKLFTKELSVLLFEKPFISKWLFDVELFQRLIDHYSREKVLDKMIEVPLNRWIDRGSSSVKFSYFFKMWIDLYRIKKHYKPKRDISLLFPEIQPEDAYQN